MKVSEFIKESNQFNENLRERFLDLEIWHVVLFLVVAFLALMMWISSDRDTYDF